MSLFKSKIECGYAIKPWFSIFVLLIIFLINQPAAAQTTGTLKGTITVDETTNKTSRRQRTGYQQHHTNSSSTTKTKETENVIIYLEETAGKKEYNIGGKTPSLTQKGAEFTPKVLPILKGTTVNIKNEDNIYHNVFSLSEIKSFNIGRRPKGESVSQTFNKTGVVRVFCDIHSQMSAYIVVLDNPFFITGDKDGNYIIPNIPPGKYLVHTWHDNLESPTIGIVINPGETKNLNLQVK